MAYIREEGKEGVIIFNSHHLLVVVHLDERQNGVLDAVKLNERHAVVIGKELELGNVLAGLGAKRCLQLLLVHIRRNVGDVQRLRGRVDVVEVLRAGALEAVQRRVGVVLRQARVLGED